MNTKPSPRPAAYGIFALLACGIFALLGCSPPNQSSDTKGFYVSPDGSDHGNGTIDAPFATIAHAQAMVRQFKAQNPSEPITVYLRDGKYYLTEPVVFTAEDSGSADAPIAYKAYENETPQVLGGVNLSDLKWEPYTETIYKAKVPEGMVFETLFINGEQQILARYPNYTEDALAFNGIAADCLSKERVATWKDPKYGYFHAMHKALWGGVHYQITGKKSETEVDLVGGTQNNRGSSQHAEYRFVENIFEELDGAGEWYLNRNTSELFFYPKAGVDLNQASVEVAALEQLFVFKGTEAEPVTHISIEGLTLKRTIRTFMKTADRLLRSDWTIYRGGVVHFEGTENCALKDSELSDLGGNAVFFNHYNKGSSVEGCHIYNVGGSGVSFVGDINTVWHENYDIGEGPDLETMNFTRGPKTNNYPQHCRVDNNLIHNTGTVEKQTAGVQISMAAYLTVSRNSIYDVPRAGINISEGKWGGHILEYNDVFLTVQETHDHGAFNSWGRDRYYTKNRGAAGDRVAIHGYDLVKLDMLDKIIIRNNRWRCDHGWDIDLDDGSAWYEIYNNVCLSGGIKLRDGMLRTVYNNININNSMNLHVWLKNSGDVVTNNISTHGYIPIGMRQWGKLLDQNLFFQKDSLKKIQNAYGTDPNSVYGDPMFADPANGDYTVTNTELAEAIGWKNFPMDQFGVQKPSLKAIAKIPEFPEIELTADEVIEGIDYMGGVIKNIENDGEKSAAGLPDFKGAKIEKGLTKGIFSVVKLQDDDVVLAMDDEAINNINDFTSKLASDKVYETMSVWRFQKLLILELPDPADCSIPMLLNKKDWKLLSFDSEADGYEAKLAIDNDPQTFWHTQFEPTEPPFPHELAVDMGQDSIIYSFEFLPRQGSSHPRIKDFELYLVADGKASDQPILKGTFKDSEDLQSFPLDKVKARYFKLVGLTGYTRNAGSVGEISFYGTCVPEASKPQSTQSRTTDSPATEIDPAMQLPENPPMQWIAREAPPFPKFSEEFEVRDGFTLIDNLDDFRAAIKRDGQKIRLKPGHYIAKKIDPPFTFTKLRPVANGDQTTTQQQVFVVSGSNNHFDLRDVVISIPSSLKNQLSRKAHVSDNWRIAGANNIFEGAYFRTETDLPYTKYFSGGNLFEVVNDGNTFLNCTFHVKGCTPYGYSDYYGKGRERWTHLDKHSFMSLEDVNGTTLRGCQIYNHGFGHGIHFHKVDGVLIEDCFFTGALRPTDDIYNERVGVAKEHNYNIMYRGERPIPRGEVIPLTEDGIRTYNEVQNVVVRNTTVERHRGNSALYGVGDMTLENVRMIEAGSKSFDVTSGDKGKIVVKNCYSDVAYNPVFGTGPEPAVGGFFEVTILSPAEGVEFTPNSGLGNIAGIDCTFILHDGTTKPLPERINVLTCGGKQPLTNSTLSNFTPARIILEKNVTGCTIRSVGPVDDKGQNNTVIQLPRGSTANNTSVEL